MFEHQTGAGVASSQDSGAPAAVEGDPLRPVMGGSQPAVGLPVGPGPGPTVWAAGDLGGVRAVIDALPEAVFVVESDGALRLTNRAADRLFASDPIHDRTDLLGRFEEVQPVGPARPIAHQLDHGQVNVTVRPREQPNRWFTIRQVPLDEAPAAESANPMDPVADSTAIPLARPGAEPIERIERFDAGAEPGGDPTDPAPLHDVPSRRTAFVLRDVTDSRDLRPVREAFLAILSHELRTPITTIYAGSSVLARRPGLSPPATRILASDISAEAARLYDLVEDLLVLARLERRVLDPLDEPVLVQRSVDAIVRTACDRFGDGLVERIGDLDAAPVRGDATYVEQALRNLVMASIRFADGQAERRLAVEIRSDRGAGEVRVAVVDRGTQLAAAELADVFELPDAAASGRLAAAGVGPSVSRHLVEAMGGRVWARNRPGAGLELGFALPIDERG